MPKNIVICCDGTGNEFGGDNNSNVIKLYDALVIDETQFGYYHPGVGTMGSPSARTAVEKQWSRLTGLAFGSGLFANVGDAYRYLMTVYEAGDDIYLFGFSRGAYTARVLASVLHMYGLLCAGNDALIPYIIRMFARHSREKGGMKETFEIAQSFKNTFSRECTIHFVGVWDTVSSVGWVFDPIRLPYSARNPSIRIGRHAVSTHERRCFYRSNLWGAPTDDQDIKQVWFTGVHSDVGGSYPESQSGLSKLTLEWMLCEAMRAGLNVDVARANVILGRIEPPQERIPPNSLECAAALEYVAPNPDADQHKSLRGLWWLLEILPHRHYDYATRTLRWSIPLGAYRQIPEGSVILDRAVKHVLPNRLPERYAFEPSPTFPPLPAISAAVGTALR